MLNHSSATERKGTGQAKSQQQTANSEHLVPGTAKVAENKTRHLNGTGKTNNALRRRAQYVIRDRSVDAQSRVLIRYALEINDPWLAELVRRAEAGERIIGMDFSQTPPSC